MVLTMRGQNKNNKIFVVSLPFILSSFFSPTNLQDWMTCKTGNWHQILRAEIYLIKTRLSIVAICFNHTIAITHTTAEHQQFTNNSFHPTQHTHTHTNTHPFSYTYDGWQTVQLAADVHRPLPWVVVWNGQIPGQAPERDADEAKVPSSQGWHGIEKKSGE